MLIITGGANYLNFRDFRLGVELLRIAQEVVSLFGYSAKTSYALLRTLPPSLLSRSRLHLHLLATFLLLAKVSSNDISSSSSLAVRLLLFYCTTGANFRHIAVLCLGWSQYEHMGKARSRIAI